MGPLGFGGLRQRSHMGPLRPANRNVVPPAPEVPDSYMSAVVCFVGVSPGGSPAHPYGRAGLLVGWRGKAEGEGEGQWRGRERGRVRPNGSKKVAQGG